MRLLLLTEEESHRIYVAVLLSRVKSSLYLYQSISHEAVGGFPVIMSLFSNHKPSLISLPSRLVYLAKFFGASVAGPSAVTYAYRIPEVVSSSIYSDRPRRGNHRLRSTYLRHPPINHKIGPIHKTSLIASQEQHRLGLLNRFAEAARWEVYFASVAFGCVVAEPVLEEWRATIINRILAPPYNSTARGTTK